MAFIKKILMGIATPWKLFKAKSPLASFITGRIITMICILFLLGFALFGLMELAPGDIVDQMMSQQLLSSVDNGKGAAGNSAFDNKVMSDNQFEALRKELGLDKPFYVQYFKWLNRVLVKHDLGTSLISRAPVGFLIKKKFGKVVH